MMRFVGPILHDRRCRLEYVIDELYDELVGALTDRHGFDQVSYDDVVDSLSVEDCANIKVLCKLTGRIRRDVLGDITEYLNMPSPSEELATMLEQELVDLSDLLPWADKRAEEKVAS